jgi:hypothetical protein
MKKIQNIIGLLAIGSLLILLITFTIGALWNAPMGGLIHNLFRYSTTIFVTLGSIWITWFAYDVLNS